MIARNILNKLPMQLPNGFQKQQFGISNIYNDRDGNIKVILKNDEFSITIPYQKLLKSKILLEPIESKINYVIPEVKYIYFKDDIEGLEKLETLENLLDGQEIPDNFHIEIYGGFIERENGRTYPLTSLHHYMYYLHTLEYHISTLKDEPVLLTEIQFRDYLKKEGKERPDFLPENMREPVFPAHFNPSEFKYIYLDTLLLRGSSAFPNGIDNLMRERESIKETIIFAKERNEKFNITRKKKKEIIGYESISHALGNMPVIKEEIEFEAPEALNKWQKKLIDCISICKFFNTIEDPYCSDKNYFHIEFIIESSYKPTTIKIKYDQDNYTVKVFVKSPFEDDCIRNFYQAFIHLEKLEKQMQNELPPGRIKEVMEVCNKLKKKYGEN